MTTIHHTPPPGTTPFAIYEDPDQEPPSPSEVYEGDVSFNSEMSLPGADDAIPSVETEHEAQDSDPEPYRGSYTSRPSILSSSQSRRTSGVTTTSFISSLPSEISMPTKQVAPANGLEMRYTPRKERPPFRNPSSVRAMQMASPPPLPAYESSRERIKGPYKLATPSRSGRSETVSTTGSRRSRSHRDGVRRDSQALQSPRPTPTPQQHLPLVLLHVTILPMQTPYAPELMLKAMPDWLVENYRLLGEKLQDVVLMRRGILIPHPRDEYDVLEERILESLELRTPRLLKCGHFVGADSDAEEEKEDMEDTGSVTDNGTGRGSRMSGGTVTAEEEAEWTYPAREDDDASVCTDCHRQVLKPGKGIGIGRKRWDLKIYAANGLMRAGAWSAAWSEMERCDVEISPWIPEDMRKALDKRIEEEQEAAKRKQLYAAELQRQMDEEAARLRKLEFEAEERRRAEETELRKLIEAEAAALQKKLEEEAAEKKRLEETLQEKIEEAKETIRLELEAQALAEADAAAERLRAMEEALKKEQEKTISQSVPFSQQEYRNKSHSRRRSLSPPRRLEDIPLGILLRNYILLLLRDQRNFLILLLSSLVVYLSMHVHPTRQTHPSIPTVPELTLEHLEPVSSVVITTSTSIMTTTSVSTLTVTEIIPVETHVASGSTRSSTSLSISESSTDSEGAVLPTAEMLPSSSLSSTPSESVPKSSATVEEASSPRAETPRPQIEPSSTWQMVSESPVTLEDLPLAPTELQSTDNDIEQSSRTQVFSKENLSVTASPTAPTSIALEPLNQQHSDSVGVADGTESVAVSSSAAVSTPSNYPTSVQEPLFSSFTSALLENPLSSIVEVDDVEAPPPSPPSSAAEEPLPTADAAAELAPREEEDKPNSPAELA